MNEIKPPNPPQPGLAALLSLLLPGLGQLYCGNLVRSLAFACAGLFAGVMLAWMLLQSGSLIPSFITLILIGFAVSVVAAIDAFLIAKRPEGPQSPEIRRLLIYGLFALLTFGAELGGAMGLALLVRDRFVAAYVIPTKAMQPTIQPGDRILAFKNVYLDEEPKRGDLVIFNAPSERRRNWIKRVVALPGETVAIQGGKLLINGAATDPEGYDVAGMDQAEDFAEVTVPDHHCFVLGDNRALSKDSRQFGPLGFGSITARVESRFWPLNRTVNLRVASTSP